MTNETQEGDKSQHKKTNQTQPEEDLESTGSKMNLKTNALFKFPFQRRARSLSLPKDEEGNDPQTTEDQEKKSLGNNPAEKTYESRQNFTIASGTNQKHSPVGKDEKTTSNNRPVIAKDNFVLAHKNLVPGVKKLL